MWKTRNTGPWVSLLACLALAVAASSALAQEEQDQSSDDRNQSQADRQDDSQRDTQGREQSERDQWSDRDQTQRQQTQRQQDQRTRRDRQRSDRDEFPAPRDHWSDDTYRSERGFSDQGDEQAARGGQGRQGGLGVTLGETGRAEQEGIVVMRVHPDSPAEEMGLRPRDRITHLNGERVRSAQQFVSQIRDMQPGEEVELEVRRDNQERTVSGELESRGEALVLSNRGMSTRRGDQWQSDRAEFRDSGEYYQGGSGAQSRAGYRGRSDFQGDVGRQSRSRSYEGDLVNQVNDLQRQVDQLNREIDQLRSSIRSREGQARQSRPYDRGETTASYQEFDSEPAGRRQETSGRWDEQDYGRDSRIRPGQQYRANYGETESFDAGGVETPGGETGGQRLRVNSDEE